MGRCDGRVIHLGDLDVFFVLINLFSNFLLQLECCYKRQHQNKGYNKYRLSREGIYRCH
jgi:hypothetical protein